MCLANFYLVFAIFLNFYFKFWIDKMRKAFNLLRKLKAFDILLTKNMVKFNQ